MATKLTFWGVRGSLPSSPSPNTKYGFNTSCISLELPNKLIILDAGTGLFPLSQTITNSSIPIYIYLSHLHWDHIQGLPFFSPFYQKGYDIHLLSKHEKLAPSIMSNLFSTKYFPIQENQLLSSPKLSKETKPISSFKLLHPANSYGYAFSYNDQKIVYCTDSQVTPDTVKTPYFETLVSFCKDATILIHDCQYNKSDYPEKKDWGHGFLTEVLALANAAQVQTLVLTHHDPLRTDDQLDDMLDTAKQWIKQHNATFECVMGYEGLTL
jgi:ribonuclease BN (tRNA processing enzyme)